MRKRIESPFSLISIVVLFNGIAASEELEELEELRREIERQKTALAEQSLRVEELERKLEATLAAVANERATNSASSEQLPLRNEITVTGTVNELLMHFDDGQESRTHPASNDDFPTRLVFRGVNDYSDTWAAGF